MISTDVLDPTWTSWAPNFSYIHTLEGLVNHMDCLFGSSWITTVVCIKIHNQNLQTFLNMYKILQYVTNYARWFEVLYFLSILANRAYCINDRPLCTLLLMQILRSIIQEVLGWLRTSLEYNTIMKQNQSNVFFRTSLHMQKL